MTSTTTAAKAPTSDAARDTQRLRTVVWVVALATVGLVFDGYDLVYGTGISTFLRDPSHTGHVTPAIAGALGSCALIGALPLFTLLPLVYCKMPESRARLASRGRLDEARAISERTGVEIPVAVPTAV